MFSVEDEDLDAVSPGICYQGEPLSQATRAADDIFINGKLNSASVSAIRGYGTRLTFGC